MYEINDIDKFKLKIWNDFFNTSNPKYLEMLNKWEGDSLKEGELIDMEEWKNEKDKR